LKIYYKSKIFIIKIKTEIIFTLKRKKKKIYTKNEKYL